MLLTIRLYKYESHFILIKLKIEKYLIEDKSNSPIEFYLFKHCVLFEYVSPLNYWTKFNRMSNVLYDVICDVTVLVTFGFRCTSHLQNPSDSFSKDDSSTSENRTMFLISFFFVKIYWSTFQISYMIKRLWIEMPV